MSCGTALVISLAIFASTERHRAHGAKTAILAPFGRFERPATIGATVTKDTAMAITR